MMGVMWGGDNGQVGGQVISGQDRVDLRYIQELLVHESSKTTEIYTHITHKEWDEIKSPLDDLNI